MAVLGKYGIELGNPDEHKLPRDVEDSSYMYGQWAGNPKGYPQKPDKCVEEVMSGYIFYQCRKKRGYGPNKLYCSQHARRFVDK